MEILENLVRKIILPIIRKLPDKTVRRTALRYYVEGDAKDAICAMDLFRQRGINPIFDILGEDVDDEFSVNKNKQDYISLIKELNYNRLQNLSDNYSPEISIKLSMLGLAPDSNDEQLLLVQDHVLEILKESKRYNVFSRIDMEDSRYTSNTLLMYKNLRQKGFDCVGVVLQSRLKRTKSDLEDLIDFKPDIRLVKGAYHNEPKDKVYIDKYDVDKNFFDLESEILLHHFALEIATMDDYIIEGSLEMISAYRQDNGQDPDYSFSMLYGARNNRLFELAEKNIQTKIYIPYGTYEKAKAYALRRFYENPSLVLEMIKNEIKQRRLDL